MDTGNVENPATEMKFEHFDVLTDVANDHYYLKRKSYKANKTVVKEWKILNENLPESIYVQAYEPRIDLLRAVIIGPQKTPYHDGLFFFDIYLPPDYPENPPNVYYHSHGYRLNPNLYASGFVCLSLINTWRGDKNQIWRKEESTILQLLVSIQGLVLNERPYFNEPGYADYKTSLQTNWVNASISYDVDAFIFSCQSMLQIMRKPPVGYADFIVEHFRKRSATILAAIKAYQNGDFPVGQFQMNDSSSAYYTQVSYVHRSTWKKIGEDLEKAFAKIQQTNESRKDALGNGKKENITDNNELQSLEKVLAKKQDFDGRWLVFTLAGAIAVYLFKRH